VRSRKTLWLMFALVGVALFAIGGADADVGTIAPELAIGSVDTNFHVDSVRPAATSALGRARSALDEGNAQRAVDIARAELSTVQGRDRAELLFFVARTEEDRGQIRAALDAYAQTAALADPLAATAHLERAELLVDRPADLLREVQPLTATAWSGQRRAKELEAVALARLGRWEEAAPRLRALVASASTRSAAYTVAAPLADWLATQSTEEARLEALSLYRRIASRIPTSTLATAAEEKAQRLLASFPSRRRQSLSAIAVSDAFVRADVYFDAMHHDEAVHAYGEIAARRDVSSDERCRALLRQGQAMIRHRERAEGIATLARVTEECPADDTRAWARFSAAKASVSLGQREDAQSNFQALLQEAPDHRLADDALYRSALVAIDNGDEESAVTSLRRLVASYEHGDMRGDARFRLAWTARKTGHFEDALRELEASIAEGPMEVAEDIQGRAAYWRARTLDDLHRSTDAAAAYEALIRAMPLSFYGQQAWARLRERNAPRATALVQELLAPSTQAPPLTFPSRVEMHSDAFARAVSMLRVGDITRAKEELGALGLLRDDADIEAVWLTAAMLEKAGDVASSTMLARRRLLAYLTTAPRERARALYRVVYPLAFEHVLDEAADEAHVPSALMRAIAREETNFDPHGVSAVGAHGIIQLMPGTARRFAQPLGLRSDVTSLERPEINLRVGGAFLHFLLARYPNHAGLVPAAYNAGEGATDRWLRERPTMSFDAWVEEIPYEETRRYTRRVLQTYGIYAALAGEALPNF
jgi:soluble lytic murein transglycosylase